MGWGRIRREGMKLRGKLRGGLNKWGREERIGQKREEEI